MNKQAHEELFRRYLDGELSGDEEKTALHMIAEDEEMRELLQFERTMFQRFGGEPDPDSFTVPDDFSAGVMSMLPQKKEKRGTVLNGFFRPRQVAFRPVYAMAALILLAFGFGYVFQMESGQNLKQSAETSTQMVADTGEKIWIRFIYFDEQAEKVEVAGDFSDWEPVALEKELVGDDHVWTGLVPVSRGEHHYMFVKDGEEWVADPLASVQRNDGFGNKNSVLYL